MPTYLNQLQQCGNVVNCGLWIYWPFGQFQEFKFHQFKLYLYSWWYRKNCHLYVWDDFFERTQSSKIFLSTITVENETLWAKKEFAHWWKEILDSKEEVTLAVNTETTKDDEKKLKKLLKPSPKLIASLETHPTGEICPPHKSLYQGKISNFVINFEKFC